MNSGLNNPEMHSQEHDADQAEPADDSAYDLFPVSFAQQRLWFLHQLDPASAEYNMPATVRLRGTLNVGALELSLQAIIARHETLRTTFPVIDDQPMQRIAPDSDLLLQRRDLRPISDDLLREAEARRLALVEAQQPFDLQRGPLLRATLLQLAEHDYLLLLTLHHIVADGWSLRLFVHEIAAYYTAHVTGQSAPLPELPIQYADFAVWQRDWLQGEALDAELAYWTQCLGGDLPVLELPSDRLPTASSGPHGARHTFFIAPTLTAELDSLSRQEHVTLFMTLLAAFNVLLFRYTRQTDLLVGTPIANRNDAELEGLIGFFANTLVVRSDLSGDPCFGELLGQVRETMLNAYDHQDLPFEKLVEVLQPERDLHHSPLFQVMFVMQQAPLPPIQLQHLTVSMIDLDPATAKFDLLLALSEKEQGLEAVLEYRADRLTATMITRLAEHYQTLLHSIVASPSARLSELKLLSDAEHRQIIAQGCAPDASRPDQAHVIHMFEAQVARSPQAVAVATDTQGLSYAELNARANQLAHHLRSLGVGPGVRVALVLNRSPELLISVLGVLKAGAAYVPLDRSYPQERLAYMLADSGAALILTQSALVDSLPATRVRCLCLDHEEPSISHAPTHNPPGSIDPEQMAYVIYTSGSTGQPKGVAMPHRPLAKLIAWHLEDPAFSHAARTLHFAPISFDVSFQELFSCWATGGTLLIADDDLRHDPAALLRWMYEAEVERLFVPFVALHQLAEAAATVDVPPLRLREIVTAGEQLQITAALNTWMRRMPGCALYNHYGPTETHVVTSYRLAGTPDAWPAQPPIGRPLAGARLYVLEPQLQPAPIGVAGELYIGGTALAHGYLDQPALTAERFIADPFSGGATSGPDNPPGARIYRTGDMARYLSDGNIEFLGRIDDQVKVRGFRVEPGEIEAVLRQHPTVRDAVVISQQHNDQIRLVAYVVGEQKNKEQEKQGDLTDTCSLSSVLCSPQELRQFLAQRLPEYMVPSAFVMLDALPLTPSGKLARRALSRHTPDAEQRDIDEPFIAPRSPAEELLANIWSSVLGRDRISIHDHFFAIGGHSLLATQIISRIRTTFNVDLPLRALFEAPTIAGLATRIEHSRRAAPEPLPPLQPLPRGRPFPLSFAQQRLWFLAQFDPGSAAYNIPLGLRLHGVLDVMALEQSLQALAARHETLRTTFTTHNGEPVQVIETSSTVMLRIIDLQAGPEHEAQVNQIIRDEERQPFDLQRGPLLRVVLLRLGRIEHVLLLTMHHIISDGWSMRILIDELAALYRASVTSIPHSADTRLPDLPIQYADFAVWQHEALLHSERFQQQVVYWRRQLAGAPTVLELPIALPRPNDQALQSATYSFEIAPTLTAELDSLSRQEHVTLFMTLLTAFNVLLFRYTRQTDLLVGTPIAGRNQHEIEPLIGFFVNTLVLRTDLAGNPAFANLLQRVRETALQAYAHQDLPFEQVVKEVQPERALHQQPLVQTAFVFQSTSLSTPELTGLELTTIDVGTETGKFDLTLLVEQIDQGLKAVFKYNQVLYPAAAIERLAGHFQTLLAGIVAQPAQPISYLPLLTLTEQQRQLFDWNTTAAPYPVGQCYHEIFETQVAHTPNAIAVIFGAGTRERVQLTYAELNSYANQLAHHLRLLGVTPETRVGICIEPSLDLVVALLGTLKAGGAYVPLDPNYPQERLQFMLEDAQVRVLLTQRRLEPALPPISAAIVLLDNWTLIAQQPITNPAHTTSSDSLAYMLYTSGSTGNPKGVLVEHKSMVNYLCWFNRMFGAHIQHLPAVTRLSFDASLKQLFGPLLRGAAVWLLPEEVMTQPALLVEALNSRAEVGFNCVPSLWSGVLDAIDAGQAEVPTTLTTLFVGGEPLHAELVRRSLARLPQLRIWNLYGPTEATANASAGKIAATAAITIGRPIANTQAYVLDPQMQPVPIGVPGELYLGGDQVARGYNNRPVLTAARFVPDPFSGTPGARLYTTGDRVCLRPDGTIEYLGRLDQQVKLRGFRIELGEIEAVLRQHPLVHECVAIVREDEPTGAPGAKRLVAYVVEEQGNKETREQESVIDSPSPITDKAEARRGVGQGEGTPVSGGEGLTTTLRAFLQTRLPGYMIPSAFVPLAALPLMPNGKLDRAALPAPNPIRPELDTTFIAPRTWIEQTLTRIWAEVLRLEQVGIHDNFFDLGGDSILSIQIAARANQAGLPLTVKQIFAYQTVAELAEVAGTQQVVQAEQGTVSGALPLTPIQRRFFEQDHPEPHHWNQSLLLATREQLSLDLLTRVMYQILAQHDALRLRFVRTAGGWQQTNSDLTTVLPCTRLDLTALPAAEQAVAVETAAATMQSQLGLEDGALFKVVFFDLGPQRGSRLLLVVHHLVVDGVSWRILLEDLEAAYQQLSQAVPPTTAIRLPPKTTSYKQWAERLVQYAYSPALAAEWEYWREAIPAQIPPLPVDQTADRLDNREGSARSITVALDADETWTLLHEVPKVYHTQINDLLLTALALTFNQRMGLSTLLVDLEGQGREPLFDDIDVSRTVGWFTAVFPVLLCLPDVDQLGDTLTSVKEQLRRIPNRGIGYGILRYLSDQPAIAAALRAQPQAEVGFNYLGQFDHLFNADALFQPAAESSGPARSAQAKRAHLVDINAGVFEDCLRVEWLYSPAHHQHATIDALAHSFCEALRQLIAHCLGVDEGGYTPSDFAAFNWSQADLADITHSIGKLMGDS